MQAIVVGKGVLGLSVAHVLSKSRWTVQVVSSSRAPSASHAAAANLSLKAQRFARDPHFALKIRGRSNFQVWLKELDLPVRYREGIGSEVLESKQDADEQWKRALQPEEELRKRGFETQGMWRKDDLTIHYENEAWVHASELLKSLEHTCRNAGVRFSEQDIESREQLEILALNSGLQKNTLFLCPGWATLDLLQKLDLLPRDEKLLSQLQKPRWSVGSTFQIAKPWITEAPPVNEAIAEKHFNGSAATLSGDHLETFVSSTTLRADRGDFSFPTAMFREPPGPSLPFGLALERRVESELQFLNQQLLLTANCTLDESTESRGLRLGFGHTELLACQLAENTFLISGAHKSGYLYAAAMEEILKSLGVPT